MSSNTLRGIGQEADGDGEGDGVATPPLPGTSAVGTPPATAAAGEPAGKLTDRMQEIRGIRSLDSTIPGTRSLDASVPDARPSLDGKIPALAATLMGVAPPVVGSGSREKGTVQGRDVHLPGESRRVAEAREVADAVPPQVGTTTISLDRPVFADKVNTSGVSEGTNLGDSGRRDLNNSHGPWYEEDPTGGHPVYEEQGASIMGRAAIGVAVAAVVSVLVFAVIRVNGAPSGAEKGAATSTPPLPAPGAAPEPTGTPPAAPSTPVPTDPTQAAASAATPVPSGTAEPTAATAPVPPLPSPEANDTVSRETRVKTPESGSEKRGAATGPPARAARSVARISPPIRPAAISPDSTPVSAIPPGITPPPLVRPTPDGWPATNSMAPAVPVAPAGAKAPGTPDRPRGKGAYDPDSTLPLNID